MLELRIKYALGSRVQGPHKVSQLWGTPPIGFSGLQSQTQKIWTSDPRAARLDSPPRARAAAQKAEEAIVAAAKDVSMAEATGLGLLEPKKKLEGTAISTMSLSGHLLTNSRMPAGLKVPANPSLALSGD